MNRRTFLMFAAMFRDKKHKHICKRCGLCCFVPHVKPETWLDGNLERNPRNPLDRNMQRALIMERGKHKKLVFPACEMLFWDVKNKVAVCTIHKVLGYEKKPKKCKGYPFGKFCLREYIFNRRNK